MTRQAEAVVLQAALVAEPPQRLEAELDQIVAAERGGSSQERLRQARVVVAQIVLEPLPPVTGASRGRRPRVAP